MSAEPTSASPWRRVALACLALAAVAVAFAVAARLNQASGAAARLRAAADALDAAEPGWRLEDLEAARPDPPPADNSALAVGRVAKALPKGYNTGDLDEKLQGLAPPRRVEGAFRQAIADELAKFAPAVAEARRLAAMPGGKHPLDYSHPPPLMRFDHVDHVRRAMALLRLDAVRLAEDGDLKAALLSCRAMLNAARSLGDEPFYGVQIQRCTLVGSALGTAERVLAQGEAADADLAELQAVVSLEERHPTGRLCARAACGETHATFEWLEGNPPTSRGFDALFKTGEGFEEWRDGVFGVSPADLRLQHAAAVELLAEAAAISRLPPHEQPAAEAAWAGRYKAEADRYRWLRMLVPKIASFGGACRRNLGLARAKLTLLAVERYRLRHGAWPARLEDLPKDLLAEVPLDPADGNPLRYKRTADGVVVYGLGGNLLDDGGAVERPAGGRGFPRDDGYRLWDAAKRRRPAAPAPAK